MNSALYIGATGMKSLSEGLNVVSNNIANVSTIGFKQQSITFSDLMYEDQGSMGSSWNTEDDSIASFGQVGMGVQVDAVRTNFSQGAFETGIELTDLAIAGKGFFQVTGVQGETFYTRAGNFRFDEDGYLAMPSGDILNGGEIIGPSDETAEIGPIQLDVFDIMPGKPSSQLNLSLNLGSVSDTVSSATNPYFGLAESYDPAIPNSLGQSGYSQALQVYDANGEAQELDIYFDGVPSELTSPYKVVEYLVADNTSEDGNQALMTGTLTFNAQGELVDMSAFTPSDPATTQDLTTWTPATISNGSPQFTYQGQSVGLNLGLTAEGEWANAPENAAAVGMDGLLLPSMAGVSTRSSTSTTGYAGANTQYSYEQDGYAEGQLTALDIDSNGRVTGIYSNGQEPGLFIIPIARFTSEDGLRREGGNLFSATPEAGTMELGRADTENYGAVTPYTIETSNVDMTREMVNMIVFQRGFQSNSKSVTTADQMLQKAMELKRN